MPDKQLELTSDTLCSLHRQGHDSNCTPQEEETLKNALGDNRRMKKGFLACLSVKQAAGTPYNNTVRCTVVEKLTSRQHGLDVAPSIF